MGELNFGARHNGAPSSARQLCRRLVCCFGLIAAWVCSGSDVFREAIAAEPIVDPLAQSGGREPSSNDPPGLAWERLAPLFQEPEWAESAAENYRSPLLFANGEKVQTAEDWQRRRSEIRHQWMELLGEWPALIEEPSVETLATEFRDGVQQQHVRFHWTPQEQTTGYLLIPPGDGKRPAVVTVYYEPESSIGLGKAQRDYGWLLAQQGFVVLSIGTTEATRNATYAIYYPSIDNARVEPLSMLAYAAANAWYVLASRDDVDAERIGIVGHSFGGKWAMFASCLFERFACAAWSDPGIMFDDRRSNINYWEPWYLGYHAKPWRKRGLITKENPAYGAYPRLREQGHDLHELHVLMAPRPFFVSGGEEDPPSRWGALWHSVDVNRRLGFDGRVGMHNRPEHNPSDEANERVVDFFVHFLKESSSKKP